MEPIAGERFEVDWAHFGALDYSGDRRKLYAFASDAEAAHLAYLLTGNPALAQQQAMNMDQARRAVQEIARLAAGNAAQLRDVTRLESLMASAAAAMSETMALHRSGDNALARAR